MMNRYYKLQKAFQKWQQLTLDQRNNLCEQLRRYRKFNCYYLAILTILAIPLIYSAFFIHHQSGSGLNQLGAILIIVGYGFVVRRTLWTHNSYQFAYSNVQNSTAQTSSHSQQTE